MAGRRREHWRRNLVLTGELLVLWFVATFGVVWFARDLNTISLAGYPLAFYMAAQGSLIVYILIVWYYAHRMNRHDQEYGVDEEGE